MKLIMTAAASLQLASAANASTRDIVVQNGPTARVTYADLDLQSAVGRAALVGRIRSAAGLLCLEDNVAPVGDKLDRTHCYRAAVTSGMIRMAELRR